MITESPAEQVFARLTEPKQTNFGMRGFVQREGDEGSQRFVLQEIKPQLAARADAAAIAASLELTRQSGCFLETVANCTGEEMWFAWPCAPSAPDFIDLALRWSNKGLGGAKQLDWWFAPLFKLAEAVDQAIADEIPGELLSLAFEHLQVEFDNPLGIDLGLEQRKTDRWPRFRVGLLPVNLFLHFGELGDKSKAGRRSAWLSKPPITKFAGAVYRAMGGGTYPEGTPRDMKFRAVPGLGDDGNHVIQNILDNDSPDLLGISAIDLLKKLVGDSSFAKASAGLERQFEKEETELIAANFKELCQFELTQHRDEQLEQQREAALQAEEARVQASLRFVVGEEAARAEAEAARLAAEARREQSVAQQFADFEAVRLAERTRKEAHRALEVAVAAREAAAAARAKVEELIEQIDTELDAHAREREAQKEEADLQRQQDAEAEELGLLDGPTEVSRRSAEKARAEAEARRASSIEGSLSDSEQLGHAAECRLAATAAREASAASREVAITKRDTLIAFRKAIAAQAAAQEEETAKHAEEFALQNSEAEAETKVFAGDVGSAPALARQHAEAARAEADAARRAQLGEPILTEADLATLRTLLGEARAAREGAAAAREAASVFREAVATERALQAEADTAHDAEAANEAAEREAEDNFGRNLQTVTARRAAARERGKVDTRRREHLAAGLLDDGGLERARELREEAAEALAQSVSAREAGQEAREVAINFDKWAVEETGEQEREAALQAEASNGAVDLEKRFESFTHPALFAWRAAEQERVLADAGRVSHFDALPESEAGADHRFRGQADFLDARKHRTSATEAREKAAAAAADLVAAWEGFEAEIAEVCAQAEDEVTQPVAAPPADGFGLSEFADWSTAYEGRAAVVSSIESALGNRPTEPGSLGELKGFVDEAKGARIAIAALADLFETAVSELSEKADAAKAEAREEIVRQAEEAVAAGGEGLAQSEFPEPLPEFETWREAEAARVSAARSLEATSGAGEPTLAEVAELRSLTEAARSALAAASEARVAAVGARERFYVELDKLVAAETAAIAAELGEWKAEQREQETAAAQFSALEADQRTEPVTNAESSRVAAEAEMVRTMEALAGFGGVDRSNVTAAGGAREAARTARETAIDARVAAAREQEMGDFERKVAEELNLVRLESETQDHEASLHRDEAAAQAKVAELNRKGKRKRHPVEKTRRAVEKRRAEAEAARAAADAAMRKSGSPPPTDDPGLAGVRTARENASRAASAAHSALEAAIAARADANKIKVSEGKPLLPIAAGILVLVGGGVGAMKIVGGPSVVPPPDDDESEEVIEKPPPKEGIEAARAKLAASNVVRAWELYGQLTADPDTRQAALGDLGKLDSSNTPWALALLAEYGTASESKRRALQSYRGANDGSALSKQVRASTLKTLTTEGISLDAADLQALGGEGVRDVASALSGSPEAWVGAGGFLSLLMSVSNPSSNHLEALSECPTEVLVAEFARSPRPWLDGSWGESLAQGGTGEQLASALIDEYVEPVLARPSMPFTDQQAEIAQAALKFSKSLADRGATIKALDFKALATATTEGSAAGGAAKQGLLAAATGLGYPGAESGMVTPPPLVEVAVEDGAFEEAMRLYESGNYSEALVKFAAVSPGDFTREGYPAVAEIYDELRSKRSVPPSNEELRRSTLASLENEQPTKVIFERTEDEARFAQARLLRRAAYSQYGHYNANKGDRAGGVGNRSAQAAAQAEVTRLFARLNDVSISDPDMSAELETMKSGVAGIQEGMRATE